MLVQGHCVGQRSPIPQELADALGGKLPAAQSDGNAVAGERIDERGGVTNEYRVPSDWLRLTIDQRRSADGLHDRSPMCRPARQHWVKRENVFQRCRPVGADHGTGVHYTAASLVARRSSHSRRNRDRYRVRSTVPRKCALRPIHLGPGGIVRSAVNCDHLPAATIRAFALELSGRRSQHERTVTVAAYHFAIGMSHRSSLARSFPEQTHRGHSGKCSTPEERPAPRLPARPVADAFGRLRGSSRRGSPPTGTSCSSPARTSSDSAETNSPQTLCRGKSFASNNPTRAPSRAAVIAAELPAGPAPTTARSNSGARGFIGLL